MSAKPQYEDYKNMILQMAWKFSRQSNIHADELSSQGNLIFVEAVHAWDGTRGAFSTYLIHCLNTRLQNYVRDNSKWVHDEVADYMCERPSNDHVLTVRKLMFEQARTSLSPKAQYIIDLLLNDPAQTLNVKSEASAKAVRGALVNHLRSTGTPWSSIWGAFAEVKTMLQEI